jgi:hypothetical protein
MPRQSLGQKMTAAPGSSAKKQPARKAPAPTKDPKRTAKKVPHPPTEKPELVVETPEPNKYAPKEKVGTPTLGRSTNYVTSVGLGKLEVVSAGGQKFPYSEHKQDLENGGTNV